MKKNPIVGVVASVIIILCGIYIGTNIKNSDWLTPQTAASINSQLPDSASNIVIQGLVPPLDIDPPLTTACRISSTTPLFSVTDLNIQPTGYQFSNGNVHINNSGVIAVSTDSYSGVAKITNGQIVYLPMPEPAPAYHVSPQVYSINSLNQVVGSALFLPYANNIALFWDANNEVTGFSAITYPGSVASGINDHSEIVGWNQPLSFNYQNGLVTWISPPVGSSFEYIFTTGISNLSETIGMVTNPATASLQKGFYSYDGITILLNPLPNDSYSFASDINERGSIVGVSCTGFFDSSCKLVRWNRNGRINNLGQFNGLGTIPSAQNDCGNIVGRLVKINANVSEPKAFAYIEGRFYDIKSIVTNIPIGENWSFLSASDINNSDSIVGAARKNGMYTGFLLKRIR